MTREGLARGGRSSSFFSLTEGIVVVEIQLAETDRLDWALKQFRRRMIRSGLFKDMRRKRFYEKPSVARKMKEKAAERRRHKDRKRAARRYDV
jgi:small subunit ribosomal protein S21